MPPSTPQRPAESWVEASRNLSVAKRTPRPDAAASNLAAYVRVRPAPSNGSGTITLHNDDSSVTVRLLSARSGPLACRPCAK